MKNTKQQTLEEVAETISQKIRFQMDIISDDFENGVQTSMKVFYKVLEDLLFYAEKEEALKQEKDKKMYSEEEVELIANEMVNWAIDNIGSPFPQSGKKFDEVKRYFPSKKKDNLV